MCDWTTADFKRIRHWAASRTLPNPPMPFGTSNRSFYVYLAPVVAARSADPGEDLISHVVTADMEGRRLTTDEALALSTQVLIAGVDTLVNFLGFLLLHLATHDDPRRELEIGRASGRERVCQFV